MTTAPQKKSIREISPIDVYKLLPRTNCRECGEPNCMAFATRIVNGELIIDNCPPLAKEEYRTAYDDLLALMAPPSGQFPSAQGTGLRELVESMSCTATSSRTITLPRLHWT